MTDQSTFEDLAVLLARMGGRSIKLSARGGVFVATVRYTGGTAQFANETLSGAVNGVVALHLTLDEKPVDVDDPTPDPTGTKIVAVVPPPYDGEPGL